MIECVPAVSIGEKKMDGEAKRRYVCRWELFYVWNLEHIQMHTTVG